MIFNYHCYTYHCYTYHCYLIKICCIVFLNLVFLQVKRLKFENLETLFQTLGSWSNRVISKDFIFLFDILRRWFTEPRVMQLWLWLVVVSMSLKSGTPSFLRELWTNRAYLYFIKSAILSILVYKNKWLVGAAGGWKLIIWGAFPWGF